MPRYFKERQWHNKFIGSQYPESRIAPSQADIEAVLKSQK